MRTISESLRLLDQIKDRVIMTPLPERELIKFQQLLNITFPDSFSDYLRHVGLFQDFLRENIILNTQEDFLFERNFITENRIKEPKDIFAFSSNGFGNLKVMKDKRYDDDLIYVLNHENMNLKNTKITFTEFISKKVDLKLKQRNTPNESKRWAVQFSIECNSEIIFLNILNKHFDINYTKDSWSNIEISSDDVHSCNMPFFINGVKVVLIKRMSKDWSTRFSFDLCENYPLFCHDSQIAKINALFLNSRLDFKLINYGIL